MFFSSRTVLAALVASAMTLTAAPSVGLAAAPAPAAAAAAMSGIVHSDRVQARSLDSYTTTLEGGETYLITVIGDGDTDLDLFVYDENGNLVASDRDMTDQCVVHVTPRWTGKFRIVIVNNGRVYNDYVLRIF